MTSRVARTTGAVTGTGTAGASAIPTGAVSFYLRAPSGAQTLLGTIPLDAQGVASLRLTSLPPGSGSLYAVYTGTDTFAGSTSPVVPQSIIAPPAECTANVHDLDHRHPRVAGHQGHQRQRLHLRRRRRLQGQRRQGRRLPGRG